MRIVIDLQGAQSTGSRNRGIGRYALSFTQAVIRNRSEHEIFIVLNGSFRDTIEPIRARFQNILPRENVRVWQTPGPVSSHSPDNEWRRKTAEIVRECFIASLRPDVVVVTSLFEGFIDDAVTSIGALSITIPTAVVLYDLIPLINRAAYLSDAGVESWYENKIGHLRRANLLLAISESSRQEGVRHLNFPDDHVVNISTAADPRFIRREISELREKKIRRKYGLKRALVMYTGGIDKRKNIEGLIRAYSKLSAELRSQHQLAIVCAVHANERALLDKLVMEQGLGADDVLLTGFVPEKDLVTLYNICKVFVFPSWHEGFGLPALEAMCCGRAVIGANASSIPEVIGREDALFDPRVDQSIADKLTEVLIDNDFRRELELHGLRQAKRFSWDSSARAAISGLENLLQNKTPRHQVFPGHIRRQKLAYISPLPPERSGISDYSAELLPELARHYEIEVVVKQSAVTAPWIRANCVVRTVQWFRANYGQYERVIYHFGNSQFHEHMFELLAEVPGVVVLHDFFLSGITAYMAHQKWAAGVIGAWETELYRAHGYAATIKVRSGDPVQHAIYTYPCNQNVVANALGLIVHSENSRRLAKAWLGPNVGSDWSVIPHLRALPYLADKESARVKVGLDGDDFVICSFGLLGATKLNDRLLGAWLASRLAKNGKCVLIFVGENNTSEYGLNLERLIAQSETNNRIRITGWTDTSIFRDYLAAADVGVQLRTLSRGETSGTVLDCMSYGIPTIVNAHGSLADLPESGVWKLPDDFTNEMLVEALESLWLDPDKRQSLGIKAREIVHVHHSPRECANKYAEAIETIYSGGGGGAFALESTLKRFMTAQSDLSSGIDLANAIASTIPGQAVSKQLLVDISALAKADSHFYEFDFRVKSLREILKNPPSGYRVEPVYSINGQSYRYARHATQQLLGGTPLLLEDDLIDISAGDIFLGLCANVADVYLMRSSFAHFRTIGLKIVFYLDSLALEVAQQNFSADWQRTWLSTVPQWDVAICESNAVASEFKMLLPIIDFERLRCLQIATLEAEYCSESTLGRGAGSEAAATSHSDVHTITEQVISAALDWGNQNTWIPDGGLRYFGAENKLISPVGKKVGLCTVTTGREGWLIHGPYLNLASGDYQVVIQGEISSAGTPPARIEVASHKGLYILAAQVLEPTTRGDNLCSINITLDENVADFEVRVWVAGNATINIGQLAILPISVYRDAVAT